MIHGKVLAFLASVLAGGATHLAVAPCTGCLLGTSGTGGSAGNEVWFYTPGAGDEPGRCLDDCTYDKQCKYKGTVRLENRDSIPNPNAGTRWIFDHNGDPQGAGVLHGGSSGPLTVNLQSPCGAVEEAAPTWTAKDAAGTVTSGIAFLCTKCEP